MYSLDIGGGFPGETYSTWNPAAEIDDYDDSSNEGLETKNQDEETEEKYMFFQEIATKVAPMIDEMFPVESGVRIIAEPGRYFVAAAATLVASVVASRVNGVDETFKPNPIDDKEAAENIDQMTREDENMVVRQRAMSFTDENGDMLETIADELADYSKLYARQHLSLQETDVYNDNIDLYKQGYATSIDLLGPPTEEQKKEVVHTVEGMDVNLVNSCQVDVDQTSSGMLALAVAGEAAVNGLVLQSVVDSGGVSDDYAYYLNDGVYSAFNNLMYDHAVVRPRHLRKSLLEQLGAVTTKTREDGMIQFEKSKERIDNANQTKGYLARELFASTVFGPTCDSIDVVARSVLLPKLDIGDWLYFHNMGAYTMAASSCFNGFDPSEKFYVCSVPIQYLKKIIAGHETDHFLNNNGSLSFLEEEKKE